MHKKQDRRVTVWEQKDDGTWTERRHGFNGHHGHGKRRRHSWKRACMAKREGRPHGTEKKKGKEE